MSDKNSYILTLLVGLVLGALLYLGFQNRENISNWFAGLTNKENEEEADETYPYFAAGVREYYLGDEGEWQFQVFQPEVVEYVDDIDDNDPEDVDSGLNYVILKYSPEGSSDEYTVKALLTMDTEGWDPEAAGLGIGLDEEDFTFERVVTDKLRVLESFDGDKADLEDNATTVSLSVFKEMFPVGSRISIMVPVSYPTADQRTPLYCATFEEVFSYMCEYGTVVDTISEGLEDFNEQKEVGEDFILLPYYYSTDLTMSSELETL